MRVCREGGSDRGSAKGVCVGSLLELKVVELLIITESSAGQGIYLEPWRPPGRRSTSLADPRSQTSPGSEALQIQNCGATVLQHSQTPVEPHKPTLSVARTNSSKLIFFFTPGLCLRSKVLNR